MVSAQYGRGRQGECVSGDFGEFHCEHDVLPVLDRDCSGTRTCRVRIDESKFPDAPPCHKDLKSSLVAIYRCLKGKRN